MPDLLVVEDGLSEEWQPETTIPGYGSRVTARGIRVIELDVLADPVKRDPAWMVEQRRRFPNEAAFRREILRDWSASSGDLYFPEYLANGGRGRYMHAARALLDGPICRGWDFGIRAPACVWFQYSPAQQRVWVLRSLTPSFMPIHDFRDLVLYLSGQGPREALDSYALQWLARIEADPTQPPAPWFLSGAKPLTFLDYAGPEAWYTSDLPKGANVARSRAEVLEETGIYLAQVGAAGARDTLMRRLLAVRDDGLPGILIDPSNELLLDALAGGLVFRNPTKEDPLPDTYAKDGVHDNVYEAVSYGLVGVVPLGKEGKTRVIVRDRRLVPEEDATGFNLYETRRGTWR